MTLRFTRGLDEMRPVLMDPNSSGPDPVYVVYKDLNNSWINKTELVTGLYGKEYPKTFGHIHADNKDEIYHVESGEGLLLLQTESEFKIIKVTAGQEIKVPKETIHCWVNVGPTPLISYDDHRDPQDNYAPVAAKHGLAYYIINEGNQPQAVSNPNYPNPPLLQFSTPPVL